MDLEGFMTRVGDAVESSSPDTGLLASGDSAAILEAYLGLTSPADREEARGLVVDRMRVEMFSGDDVRGSLMRAHALSQIVRIMQSTN